jgi:hypothetical protein
VQVEQRKYKRIGQTVVRHTDVSEKGATKSSLSANVTMLNKSKRVLNVFAKQNILELMQARVCTRLRLQRITRLTSDRHVQTGKQGAMLLASLLCSVGMQATFCPLPSVCSPFEQTVSISPRMQQGRHVYGRSSITGRAELQKNAETNARTRPNTMFLPRVRTSTVGCGNDRQSAADPFPARTMSLELLVFAYSLEGNQGPLCHYPGFRRYEATLGLLESVLVGTSR